MNAARTVSISPAAPLPSRAPRAPMIGLLRALLLGEMLGAIVLTILLSMLAAGLRDFLGGDAGIAAEERVRFAAGGTFVFAILAAFASRGARRRRPWAWTLAAVLQVMLAVGTGAAIFIATWTPLYLVGFAFAIAVMLVLSTASVRRALGQG